MENRQVAVQAVAHDENDLGDAKPFTVLCITNEILHVAHESEHEHQDDHLVAFLFCGSFLEDWIFEDVDGVSEL